MLFRKLMWYLAFGCAHVMSSIIIDGRRKRIRRKKSVLFLTNISMLNRNWKKCNVCSVHCHRIQVVTLCLNRQWRRQQRWCRTTMWKLSENNKLNFVRVQCVAQPCHAWNQCKMQLKWRERASQREKWRERARQRPRVSETEKERDRTRKVLSFSLSTDHIPLCIHGISHFSCLQQFRWRGLNAIYISYLHSISIRSSYCITTVTATRYTNVRSTRALVDFAIPNGDDIWSNLFKWIANQIQWLSL